MVAWLPLGCRRRAAIGHKRIVKSLGARIESINAQTAGLDVITKVADRYFQKNHQ